MSTPASMSGRAIWRAGRGPLLVMGLISLVGVVVVLLGAKPVGGGYLDPVATTSAGAKAIAQLLRDRGINVHTVSTLDQAKSVANPNSTIVFASADIIFGDELAFKAAELPGDRLLIAPSGTALEAMAPGVKLAGHDATGTPGPDCGVSAAVRAGDVHMSGAVYSAPSSWTGCYFFFRDQDPKQKERLAGLIRTTDQGNRTTTVVGGGAFLTNRLLGERGNAALAMNLAGGRPTVIWYYRPTPELLPGEGERSFDDLIPSQVNWFKLQACIAIVLLALWRMRRLGPVVAERLPVVVRASETVEGRGRLYRSRHARDRAADALRAGALARITPRLGLTSEATPPEVASAIAVRTGQDATSVGAALYGYPPPNDAGLMALAEYLDTLERQVRQS